MDFDQHRVVDVAALPPQRCQMSLARRLASRMRMTGDVPRSARKDQQRVR